MSNPALLTGNSAGIFNRGNFKAGGGGEGGQTVSKGGYCCLCQSEGTVTPGPPGYALGSQPMSLRLVH